ncbi:hypothetical protein IMG5_182210 [Ichthyophthirius multifiliis]|uniref:Uncharacterized protein n=1 Tax=Ichthyophthirius multifiliis TaxID=5932 RepID=G0R305_ICHMU|nr:hypothetical protein IMG5_182210 [Ichthyophthirius multifiliis]EGR28137.1 hypothetical protein IMG5_182210 [Ichthyophthirius multifiliis]|eukprot:XP_004027482.1 hypothetical protein IMG5_182210 [Ichthyophthirius multifiliis]
MQMINFFKIWKIKILNKLLIFLKIQILRIFKKKKITKIMKLQKQISIKFFNQNRIKQSQIYKQSIIMLKVFYLK